MEDLAHALKETADLPIPLPVEPADLIPPGNRGARPKLPLEAFELARQVYYLQHGSVRDAARAIIAEGLSDTEDLTQVYERLQTWWQSRRWLKRATSTTFAIRDAHYDGGLYRGARDCTGETTGSGPAPVGKPCGLSAMRDSEYCFYHDPRPEYVQARLDQAAHLARGRQADAVPLEPFQAWCERTRRELLEQAKQTRQVHPNNTGWSLLAKLMSIDASVLARIMRGTHNGGAARAGRPSTTIRAATVTQYAQAAGVTFQEIYGFDPPTRGGDYRVCPSCGGEKNHMSRLCRSCYEATEGEQCTYVTRAGRRCVVLTKHPSGYCSKCRRIVERVPRPRRGRPSRLTGQIVMLALGEYRDVPTFPWVAARLWEYNAGDVRAVYGSEKSLKGALTKRFRKEGWATTEDAERAYEQLVAEHGEVAFPAEPVAGGVSDVALVPLAPFAAWLAERKAEVGSYAALATRTTINADQISKWLRADGAGLVRRHTIDRALESWGDGTTFHDLYKETA